MSETTEFFLKVARTWMMDAKDSVVVLPAGICNTLTQAWDKDKVAFKEALDKLDMELTVSPDKGDNAIESVMTLTLSFYPSMEYLGPRTAVIYISPSFLAGAIRREGRRNQALKPSLINRFVRWVNRIGG